jgi:assimilatory nitrate reductase catalytic subunit
VFLPFHFAQEENANLLTSAAVDPISGMPEFKASSVTVTAGIAPSKPAQVAFQVALKEAS